MCCILKSPEFFIGTTHLSNIYFDRDVLFIMASLEYNNTNNNEFAIRNSRDDRIRKYGVTTPYLKCDGQTLRVPNNNW